jgi:DNA-binding SARP family transcriptional activator
MSIISRPLLACSRSFVPILFLWSGLNAIDLLRKKRHASKSKEGLRKAIAAMKDAAANSEWNFMNKLRLLEAEQQSITHQRHFLAIDLYDASIQSAKKSGFIHEQGLACEKAGFYFKNKAGNNEKALEYFKQARACYDEWGSKMKVDFIKKEIDSLNVSGS